MAWNEPGGGKGPQDPWRGGGSDQGPPDLEEIIKKLHSKLLGKGGGKGPGGRAMIPKGMMLGVVVVLVIVTLMTGFYRVEEAEQAVVLRFGKYLDTKGAGLQWNLPLIDQVLKANTQLISSHTHQAHMLTSDQNIVEVKIEVQYLIKNPGQYFLEIADPKDSLFQSTESALRHVVGGQDLNAVLTERRVEVAAMVKLRIQEYLDDYSSGLKIQEVNIQDAHPPEEVKLAFDDVIKAKEDKERFKNEAEAYQEKVLPEAKGRKERILAEAEAYKQEKIDQSKGEIDRFNQLLTEYQLAPKVTRKRLYLESMEAVLSNTTKVMVDLEGNNNLVYLPLDKLMSQGGRSPSSNYSGVGSSASKSPFNSSSSSTIKNTRSNMRRAPVRESR